MEITVISAEGLKTKSSALFSHRLRPFVSLTLPPCPYRAAAVASGGDINKPSATEYKTRVDERGGVNPTWGDKFRLPIDPATFLYQTQSFIYLHLYTKRLSGGQTQLGWCHIPAADIADGLSPAGSVRHLSYRLRAKDGSRSQGVVNLAVKLEEGSLALLPQICHRRPPLPNSTTSVIGIPVTMSMGLRVKDI